MTTVLRTPEELRRGCDEARADGRRVGLVPTMGALHDGHLSLIDEVKRRTDFVAVTIFVNPLQFGDGEDLERYPRTVERDLESCRARGVDVVFTPEPAAMYPRGFQTQVSLGELTKPLEGEFRPTHFDGVTTVVTKLFNLAGPSVAVFGRKDYQQWKILARLALDLDMPIEVVGCPVVRETDGLALSSRNRYLSGSERKRALGIVTGLRAAYDAWTGGERSSDALRAAAAAPVEARFDRIDYVAAADPETLGTPQARADRLLIAVAAHLGSTRLIDNVVLGEDPRP
ncbi:MAG: pantoate--beta-alanine ligase [Deltaproteobacteria bacterium]|jgi:pantoate--beta-alanine ligase|nr:pantoate--beta-alanine ligase [Deltaproteobacteria bacterium]